MIILLLFALPWLILLQRSQSLTLLEDADRPDDNNRLIRRNRPILRLTVAKSSKPALKIVVNHAANGR